MILNVVYFVRNWNYEQRQSAQKDIKQEKIQRKLGQNLWQKEQKEEVMLMKFSSTPDEVFINS